MKVSLDLADRRALVTGGTEGIGAAVVAATLRDEGVNDITTARSAPETLLEAMFSSWPT